MTQLLSRRQLAAGIASLALVRSAYACAGKTPPWVDQLRIDLERMARDLTARVRPWKGPSRVVEISRTGQKATETLQAAIDSVAKRGGGTVRLVHGDHVSGTLDLRSNIRLEISQSARLLASFDLKDYPERIAERPTVMDSNMGMNQSRIFAEGCNNIAICGDGVIDGRGSRENFPGTETVGSTPGRPFLIRVLDCKGVHVKGLHLRDSPCWMQNYLNCEDLLVEELTVENQANFNNDGLDIDGCRRVIVRHCFINSEDDALCFKGASQRPMEQVLVENCRFYSSCNGLKFGTDSQGDFRQVLVRNVEVGGPSMDMRSANRRRADSGISWEVVDGNTIENVLATNVRIVRAESPLFLRLGDRGRTRPGAARPAPGKLRRIVFEHVRGDDNGSRGSYFLGLGDAPIEEVAIRDLRLEVSATHEPVLAEAAVPQWRADYPDAHMIGKVAPAYGLWARDVKGLTLENVSFDIGSPDPRPAVIVEDPCVR